MLAGFSRSIRAIGISVGLAACSTLHVDTAPTTAAERIYSSLYSYYVEVCAISELKKKPGSGVDISSGVGGHAVLYLDNVCRDDAAHYPTIKLCAPETPAGKRGVGLSVNAHYKNANWVATAGRDFFFHGGLQPDERLTRAAYERTQLQAKAMGILDGVEFHEAVFEDKPEGMSRRDYMYEISVATDYAIAFGRDRYCARRPVDRDQMAKIVDYLNGINAPYRDGKKAFEWSVLRNNCSHVAHNALAVAGLWDEWETDRFILFAAFDFPVPKNEFVNLMRRTNDFSIDDLDAVYEDGAARRALLESDTLPTAPGALAEAEPARQDNDMYDTDLSLIFYDQPLLGPYQSRFERIFAEPRYTDLRANLQHFANLYDKIRQQRQPFGAFLARQRVSGSPREADLARFYARYYEYIGRMSAGVRAELGSLPPAAAAQVSR